MKNAELQNILKNREGLKFNLNDNSNKRDILFRTLELRGIEDPAKFGAPEPGKDFKLSNPFKLFNTKYWTQYFIDQTKQGYKDIYIVVDNDADGFSSAALLYMYLNNSNYITDNIHFLFSEGKSHGIHTILNEIIKLDNAFLVIPDANITMEDQNILLSNGIDYLVIDHHDLENEDKIVTDFLPIINNQLSSNKGYVNKEFTGVGMIYQFCKMLDYNLNQDYADKLLYLFAIGQVGDVSDVSDLEIRYLMLLGFNELDNSEILKNTTDTNKPSPHELSFSIIPKINAVCRTGSIEEKEMLINAMVGKHSPEDKTEIKIRRKSPIDNKFHYKTELIDYYSQVARKLTSIKNRQNRSIKKSVNLLTNIQETKSFIVALDSDNQIPSTENGLLATRLANQYQKPAMVLHPTGFKDGLGGSARGFTKVMKDFKAFCLSTQLFVFAAGHGNAFGLAINKDNLEQFIREFDYDFSEDNVYDVDNIYLNSAPVSSQIEEFNDNRSYFGGKVSEPKLGFVGLEVGLNVIRLRGNVLSFKFNGVTFTKFNLSEDLKDNILNHTHQHIYLDIVGSPNINNFMKYSFPQIIIDDIKISNSVKSTSEEKAEDFMF